MGVFLKRFAWVLMLAAMSGSAAAEWVRFADGDDGMVVYTDPATLRRTGDTVRLSVLLDYKAPQPDDSGKKYMSAKLQHEYDCKDTLARTIYFSLHSGEMGKGTLTYSELRRAAEWLPARRMKLGGALWEFACTGK